MILLLGDWVPEQNQPLLEINTCEAFVLVNLEGPIIPNPSNYMPVLKSGPHLYSTFLPDINDAVEVCFSLANNHIKDYGWSAVQATIKSLNELNYHWVGVGETEKQARKPLILSVSGVRYAVFSICEIQAGRATTAQPGSATIGPWIYQAINQLRPEVDIIIVSIHAANEFLPWPSPLIQDLYRSYIDAGVDIVHGHHSHIPQGVERYKNGLICYGLGNFLGSPNRYSHFETQLSLGVRIIYSPGQIDYKIEPYRFQYIDEHVLVREQASDQFDAYFSAIQKPLKERPLLEAIWQEAALRLYGKYGRDSIELPYTTENRYLGSQKQRFKYYGRRLKRCFAMTPNRIHQNQMLWYNIFACLSHQHMMETALGVMCGEITDIRSPQARELVDAYLQLILNN